MGTCTGRWLCVAWRLTCGVNSRILGRDGLADFHEIRVDRGDVLRTVGELRLVHFALGTPFHRRIVPSPSDAAGSWHLPLTLTFAFPLSFTLFRRLFAAEGNAHSGLGDHVLEGLLRLRRKRQGIRLRSIRSQPLEGLGIKIEKGLELRVQSFNGIERCRGICRIRRFFDTRKFLPQGFEFVGGQFVLLQEIFNLIFQFGGDLGQRRGCRCGLGRGEPRIR